MGWWLEFKSLISLMYEIALPKIRQCHVNLNYKPNKCAKTSKPYLWINLQKTVLYISEEFIKR